MFADKPQGIIKPEHYNALKNSKTIVLHNEDHDVFGDGTVVLKTTPGHTPGHQALFVKLAKTGPLLLAGDLYHYPEERTFKRFPDLRVQQRAVSREPRGDGRLHEEDRRRDVDRARQADAREAEEGAGVLRLASYG